MTGKNNLLIVHRYFWPQNYPYATMLKDIAEVAAGNFNSVSIASTHHDYSELATRQEWADSSGFELHSFKMQSEKGMSLFGKIVSMLKYCIWLCLTLLQSRPDVVMVATTPPILTAFLVRCVSKIKGFSYIYHCQDIHPEASRRSLIGKVPFLYQFLRYIDNANVKHAKKVIVLSSDMKKTLIRRGASANNIHVINNFVYQQNEGRKNSAGNNSDEIIRFVFAGTLGRLQNLPFLFELIKEYKTSKNIEFHILGDGLLKAELESAIESTAQSNVIFYGQVPLESALERMSECDIGIVSLAEEIIQVAYPSKTMMYLSNGLSVLALVEQDSELVDFLEKNKLGIAVSNTSHQQALNKLNEFLNTFTKDEKRREAIKRKADEEFGKKMILSRFREVIQ